MTRPDDDLALLADGTARLLAAARGCTDADVRRASLLPDWTRGHVLTHLARNADSQVRRLWGALHGEVLSQYEGGREGRNADIEAGAVRELDVIVDDLVTACVELEQFLAAVPDEVWDAAVVEREYFTASAATLPFTRVMEVEVHHVDLGLGYGPADWPAAFVDRALPTTMDRLARRAGDVTGPAASWHLHRTDGDGEWVIKRTPEGSTVTAEHAKSDCAVRGPGYALLAWLLGRLDTDAAGLEALGDAAIAGQLPTLYPYG